MNKQFFKERMVRGLAAVLASALILTNMDMTAFAAVSQGTESTEATGTIKALQSRINALPTVDDFIALADGTTAAGSTLNQAQMDVYNEAQAIADEMDDLTDEEQGQLDTGKLEALFEYWNNETEELDVPSSAFEYICVSGVQLHDDDSLKSINVSLKLKSDARYDYAVGKIAITNKVTSYYYADYGQSNVWFDSNNADKWPSLTEIQKVDSTVLAIGDGDEFEWTDKKDHTLTAEFTKGQVNLSPTTATKYYVYLITRSTHYGIYPDCLLATLTAKEGKLYDKENHEIGLPTGKITVAEKASTSLLDNVTFNQFSKEKQTVTINAIDADEVYYYNSDKALPKEEVEKLADTEWTTSANNDSYKIDEEGQHVVYAKLVGKSGKKPYTTYISSDGFVIDRTEPEITNVVIGGDDGRTVSFTATDANPDTVTVDGNAATLGEESNYSYQFTTESKSHTIVATDKAGNTATMQIVEDDKHEETEPEIWKEPVFTWSANYSSATATFTCKNSESHTQTKNCKIEKVTEPASGSAVKTITYTATVTVDGKKYTDKKTQVVAATSTETVGASGGSITAEIIVSKDMPETTIQNLTASTAALLLNVEEKSKVEGGEKATIYLEANSLAENAVSNDDKDDVANELNKIMESAGLTSKERVTTGIQYMDLSLYKKIGDADAQKLTSTGDNKLTVTIEIPAALKSTSSRRSYYVIRVHESGYYKTVDKLEATRSGNALTFETDLFSTYAIAFTEPKYSSSVTLQPEDEEEPDETPETEDQSALSGNQISKLKLPLLLATGTSGARKISVSWSSCEEADGYDCYRSYCDGKLNYQKFATVKAAKNRVINRHLNAGRHYKYFVAAYKLVDGKKVYIAKSKPLHIALTGAKKTNAKKVIVDQTAVTLKAGETFTVKSRTKLEDTGKKELLHVAAYRYQSSDQSVASVSKNGKVTALTAGTCVIYVLANNGVYAAVRVTVNE